ncbi:MAG: YfbM family protein [Massilia sp.]
MSMIGNLLAVPQSELDALFDDPGQIAHFLYETHADDAIHLDKTWHAIHFMLTGEVYDGDGAISQAILGGDPIGEEEVGYEPARGLSVAEVKAIDVALRGVSEADFRAKFDAAALTAADIYPQIWEEGDGALDYLVPYFMSLKQFYENAAQAGLAVVLFIN